MKTIPFIKMAGAGNDFLVIDAPIKTDVIRLAQKMCDRHEGVGADGLLILEKSKKADYKMRIINADGSEAEMCGNGARCMAAYITEQKTPKKSSFTMETLAGLVAAEVKNGTIRVHLSDPVDYAADISLPVNERVIKVHYIDTGVPHTIVFVDGLKNIDVFSIGRQIRDHKQFAPKGTNVNFVEQLDTNSIEVRTYERGVEDETRACGTGSVASAIVAYLKSGNQQKKNAQASVKVLTQSKEVLDVSFNIKDNKVSNVWLKGSAKFIARGEYYV